MPLPFDREMNQGDGDLLDYGNRRPSRLGSIAPTTSMGPLSPISNQIQDELDRLGGALPSIEELLMNRINATIDFNQYSDALNTFAGGITDQFFRPGGMVEQASRQALGQTVQTGFGPQSGGFDAARMNILAGARDQVGQAIGSQAVNLAQMASGQRSADIQTLLGFAGMQGARRDELARDLFGIQQTGVVNQLDRDTFNLNRRMVENALAQQRQQQGGGIWEFLGGLGGSVLGGTLGMAGMGIGEQVGSQLGNWLGGMLPGN